MRTRVTIGDFSRASHLSVKTLRRYHEVGLLEPGEVGPDNGYRYYSEDQIPLAQGDPPTPRPADAARRGQSVLAAPDSDARNELIVEHLDRLELELVQTRATVGELRNLPQPEAPHLVEHRSVHATPAIGIQETVDRDDIFARWQGALGELHATARPQSLTERANRRPVRERDLPTQPRRGDRVPADRRNREAGRTHRLAVGSRNRARGHAALRVLEPAPVR
jgi:MerR family regulatory protein